MPGSLCIGSGRIALMTFDRWMINPGSLGTAKIRLYGFAAPPVVASICKKVALRLGAALNVLPRCQ